MPIALLFVLLGVCVVLLAAVVYLLLRWDHGWSALLLLVVLGLCFLVTPPSTISQLHISIMGGNSTNSTTTSDDQELEGNDEGSASKRGNSTGGDSTLTDWRQCIIQMGNHMNVGTTEWILPNTCGFESRLSIESMRPVMFPSDASNVTVVYLGDSLSQRALTYDVNKYYPPNFVPVNDRMKRVPNRWVFTAYHPLLNKTETVKVHRRSSKMLFRKGPHIHDTIPLVLEEIADACVIISRQGAHVGGNNKKGGGILGGEGSKPSISPPVEMGGEDDHTTATGANRPSYRQHSSTTPVPNIIFMTFGNWDMNWKVNNVSVPGLVPGVPYYNITMGQVEKFWASEVDRLFVGIDGALAKCRKRGGIPPFVVLREQYMSECNSGRFLDKGNTFRECSRFLYPTLVPLLRRILAATAWSYNVPVIPSEHLFAPGSRCRLHDGLHMGNVTCMELEHQQHWGTYHFLQQHNVTQGRLPLHDTVSLDPSKFVNVKHFYEHLDLLGVGKYYRGQKYPVSYGRPPEGEEPSDP